MAVKRITEAEMNEQGVIAAPDILNGTPAQNKAIFDRMVRNLVAPAVNACAEAVDEVNANQEEWGKQEQIRETNEEDRKTAEVRREEAEATRETNETARKQAEGNRSLAEGQRAATEQARREAETVRQEKEQERDNAEQSRTADEATRRDSEAYRVEAENARNLNEAERQRVEALRVEVDSMRETAEAARQQAEQERKTAEETRETNESARVNAEQERRREHTAMTEAEFDRVEAERLRKQAETTREENETKRTAEETTRNQNFAQMKNLIENLDAEAQTLEPGAEATADVTVDPETGGYKISFGVPAGKNGTGTGDMLAKVYDPQGRKTDIFAYADGKIAKTDIVQATGSDAEKVMSQKAVTDALNGYSVPGYWKTAVDALSDAIKERQAEAGAQAFQFVWFSDPHGVDDFKTSDTITSRVTDIGNVSQYVAEKFDIPFVAISGDIMSQASHSSEDGVFSEYEAMWKLLAPVERDKMICGKGNHDGSYFTASGVSYLKNIGSKQIYNVMFRRQALERERVFGGDGSYFYVDDPASKVRFIMLNGHTDGDGSVDANGYAVYNSQKNGVYGTEQLAWLADVALDVTEGWGIVVMAHQPIVDSKDGALLNGILKAYAAKGSYADNINVAADYWGDGSTDETYTRVSASVNFENAKGEIIAMFTGHKHQDLVYGADDYGYACPVIVITTAGADVRGNNLNYPREVGTATETALDIVTVDRLNKKIYCIRLGAGVDRIVGYGDEVVLTYIISNSLLNCTNSNSATTIESGKPYTGTITANDGYELVTVTVYMGNVDVTQSVYSNGVIKIPAVTGLVEIAAIAEVKEAETYDVTNTLKNCSTSNNATTVTAGTAYSATITAADGYTLEGATVSVKMGGTDITETAYSNGTITIASVTGPIVIDVSAVEESDGYTNLFDINGAGFTKQSDTKYLTNWIPYNAADNGGESTIYHFKGFANDSGYTNPYKVHFAKDENGTDATTLMYCTNASTLKNVDADYDSSVKLVQHKFDGNSDYHYAQFEFREALPSNLIITANQNIVD